MTDIALDEKAPAETQVEFDNVPPGLVEAIVAAWNRRSSPSQVAPANPAQVTDDDQAEKFRKAMLMAERILGAIPASVSGKRLTAIDPVQVEISRAVSILWGARQDAIHAGWNPTPANPAQVTDAMMPAYGTVDFLELGKDVNEVTTGQRLDFDFGDGYPGHAMLPALNFNSLSRIVSKYITAAIGAGSVAVAVKPLEWQPGVVDWARPLPGMKYVACSTTPAGAWAWWLDDAPETRAVFPSEAEAKAAAQADYERRIRSALSQPHPADERVVEALREAKNLLWRLQTVVEADLDRSVRKRIADFDAFVDSLPAKGGR